MPNNINKQKPYASNKKRQLLFAVMKHCYNGRKLIDWWILNQVFKNVAKDITLVKAHEWGTENKI